MKKETERKDREGRDERKKQKRGGGCIQEKDK